MLYLGGTPELTALHAALLANGNHNDIDTIVQSLDHYAFANRHTPDHHGVPGTRKPT